MFDNCETIAFFIAPSSPAALPHAPLLAFIFEILFAIYFSFAVWEAVRLHFWMSVPFMMMFASGFWYAALGTIVQSLPANLFGSEQDKDPISPASA